MIGGGGEDEWIMAPEKPLEFTSYARSRMQARNLTENHASFCILHHTETYKVKGIKAWVCKLPDGRTMKVKTKDNTTSLIVIDIFTYT